MLGNFSQGSLPFRRKTGDYLPLNEQWEIHDAYVLEITKNGIFIEKSSLLDKSISGPWTMIDHRAILERAICFPLSP
jgi:hypothetical protein